ncbi:PDDEXK-like family protein [Priestia megaterium]|uniref:PDDEXK-like family protein n=1 Tax=Priestia megaterium TaxID=1404 RepID=UPI0012935B09|nr:PD-(D/E)XK nuclease family protein [Priestia megaterium]
MITNLLTDKDFIRLKKTLNAFDPFRVLGVVRSENKHSNVLAWLLDPNGNHKIKDQFINNFLRSVLLYNDCQEEFPSIKLYSYNQPYSEVYDVETLDLCDVKIIREWSEKGKPKERRIDILGISEKHKFVFFIENKIDSKKKKEQLEDCYNIVKSCFDGYSILPIFLTLDYEGLGTSENMYKTFSYDHLSLIIQRSTQHVKKAVNNFITQYLKILEDLTNLKENTFNQCQNLNTKYSTIINEYKLTRNLSLEDKITIKFLKFNKGISTKVFKRASKKFAENYRYTMNGTPKEEFSNIAKEYKVKQKEFWFTNSGWLGEYLWKDSIPAGALTFRNTQWPLPYPIIFKFVRKDNKLILQLLIAPEKLIKEYSPNSTLIELLELIEREAQSKYADKLNYKLSRRSYHLLWEITEDFTDWGNVSSLYFKMKHMYLKVGGQGNSQKQTILGDLDLVLKQFIVGEESL